MSEAGGSGEQVVQPNDGGGTAAEVTRHNAIPETFFDPATKAYKFDDIGAALTEAQTLKAATDARAKDIPAKADGYKFDLPPDFKLPNGYQWQADPKDPLVSAFRDYAATNKLTQAEVSGITGIFATHKANEIATQQAFEAEQTKALGANADTRRQAAKDWIAANTTPDRAKVLETMLLYAPGVEAIEDLIAKSSGVTTRGNGGNPQNKANEIADRIGTAPAMSIFNAA